MNLLINQAARSVNIVAWIFVVVAVIAAVALIPFRRTARWSWWALLAFVVFGMYSLIPAAVWQGSGPQAMLAVPLALTFASLLVALSISWRVGFPRSPE
jgi:hypothetical protein